MLKGINGIDFCSSPCGRGTPGAKRQVRGEASPNLRYQLPAEGGRINQILAGGLRFLAQLKIWPKARIETSSQICPRSGPIRSGPKGSLILN